MDPNEALRKLRELVCTAKTVNLTRAESTDDTDIIDGFMLQFKSLDEWISKGGLLPDAWRSENGTRR